MGLEPGPKPDVDNCNGDKLVTEGMENGPFVKGEKEQSSGIFVDT